MHHSLVPGASENPAPSARAYFASEVPFGSFKTFSYAAWGFASVWDHLAAGRTSNTLGLLSLLLAAVEQAAMDEGRWQVAWLPTTLPEPPLQAMSRRPAEHSLRPFAKLADPQWIAAAVSYMRDVDKLQSVRRGLSGGKGAKGPDSENNPERQRQRDYARDKDKGKGTGSGKGHGAGRGAAGAEA